MSDPAVSLLLVAHDDAGAVLDLLVALSRLDDEVPFEVVVADDGGDEAIGGLLASLDGDVRIVRSERREGFGPACDRAAAAACGDVLVVLDTNATPVDGWLAPLVAAVRAHGAPALPGAARADGTLADPRWWPCLAVPREQWQAVGGFAGTARPARPEKACLLDALPAPAAAPGSVVLV